MAAGGKQSLGARLREEEFDILRRRPEVVYLDTAATSLKPNKVLQSMHEYYHNATANVHKGVEHELSKLATEQYEGARKKVAQFINAARPEEICFTRNATEAINIVSHGWGLHNQQAGDEILMSVAEHHSSLAPWQLVAEKTGAKIVDVKLTEDTEEIDLADLEAKLSDKTKLVVMVHLSNVLGAVLPADRVCQMAHKVGAKVLLDSCQFLPHRRIDVQALGCDWLVASGHKALGPTSSGFLWGRFEAGTPAIAEAIGFGAAIDYLSAIGMDSIHEYESELAKTLYEQLEGVPGMRIFGPPPDVPMGRASLCAFQIEGCNMKELAAELDKRHFAVSAGFHCAKPLHEDYFKVGPTMRASAYIYNNTEEVERFVAALKECADAMRKRAGQGQAEGGKREQ